MVEGDYNNMSGHKKIDTKWFQSMYRCSASKKWNKNNGDAKWPVHLLWIELGFSKFGSTLVSLVPKTKLDRRWKKMRHKNLPS